MAAGFFVLPAFAQHMNAPDAPCPSSRMGGAEGTRCFYDAAKKADGELAETYRRTLSVLDAAGRGQLQRAQETWLRYRAQTCRAEYDLYGGGTGGLTALPACLEAETRQRIEDLEAIYGWKVEKFGG